MQSDERIIHVANDILRLKRKTMAPVFNQSNVDIPGFAKITLSNQ